jgi:hypothetical protein
VFVLGSVDWLTGYELNFFVFYFLPVSLVAWLFGFPLAVVVAVLSALTWFGADVLSGHVYSSHVFAVWNTTIRLVSFLAIAWSVARVRQALDREREGSDALRRALSEIKVLETFLPICAQCKKIRNKEGVWQQMEVYIGQHSNTQFSHGYCPTCARKAMEEAGLINDKTEPEGPSYGSQARRT